MSYLAGLIATAALLAPQSAPPIFQPGAPGQPSRVITADQALALARTSYTAEDVQFMQHMIVHHAQAVEMVALLETQGENSRVKLLGRRIALSQEAEMELMRSWLIARDQSTEMQTDHSGHGMGHGSMDHSAHAGHAMAPSETPLMPGMLSPAQMARLAAARGNAFDRLFLTGMIQHHQGAIDMVADLLEHPDAGRDTLLSDFTNSVVADQSTEILRMQSLLSDL
ncbi:DUF305 domain-containing protein [Brevundimonas sp. M20]|uniref:DUF305 domain-containing protein n=1 Tax=Brevundimonas sp. M20 TaxID=2591463 RepID=UPI001146E42E|nr:DUF305 domain-containing protein [Brevundimonas sp. M20]QDH73241.1 DUF305 domain-containing protein [Brevundimonas sp. M20]